MRCTLRGALIPNTAKKDETALSVWADLNIELRPLPEGVIPCKGEADFFAFSPPFGLSVLPRDLIRTSRHENYHLHQVINCHSSPADHG
jgi:hypothetical protein